MTEREGLLRCKECGRMQRMLANNRLKLCRACNFRRWQIINGPRYRKATPEERELLDETREKLVVAFLKGDMHTWARAEQMLDAILLKMRVRHSVKE